VESSGGVVKSIDDGLNWASITTPPNSNTPKSIIWSSELNKFVIVYRTGDERVAYSSNGDDWFNVIVSLNEWNDIAWSPQLGLFVAVAGTGDYRVMTSTDGINWIDGTIPLYLWESVEWSDLGLFIAIATDGFIAYSSDGFNWTESILSGSLYGGCWSKELGIFVVVGIDILYTSSLKNRKPTNENIFNNEFNSIDENGTWTFNALNTNSILLNGSSVSTLISDKQDKLVAGTNISIDAFTSEISCDLSAGTNINITDGVISSTGGGTTLTGGTNITIDAGAVNCDLSAGTNIDITAGVISSTGGGTTLTGGTNITIEGGAVNCDLSAGTNIDITAGVISSTGGTTLTGGTNITIEGGAVNCDLSAGTNIDITAGVISSTGGGTTIDATTDLSCKSLTTTGNATIGGSLSHRNDYAHFYIEADQTMATKFDTTYTIINYLNGSTIGNAISIGSTDGTTNNDLFIAQKSGYFKVNASFNYINTLNTERVSARTQLYKNNSYVDGNGEGYAYIRFGEGRNGSNVINSIIQLNINDRVSAVVSVRQGANTFFVNQTNHLNLVSASVVFEFIGE
jgi:hypothetical protein